MIVEGHREWRDSDHRWIMRSGGQKDHKNRNRGGRFRVSEQSSRHRVRGRQPASSLRGQQARREKSGRGGQCPDERD